MPRNDVIQPGLVESGQKQPAGGGGVGAVLEQQLIADLDGLGAVYLAEDEALPVPEHRQEHGFVHGLRQGGQVRPGGRHEVLAVNPAADKPVGGRPHQVALLGRDLLDVIALHERLHDVGAGGRVKPKLPGYFAQTARAGRVPGEHFKHVERLADHLDHIIPLWISILANLIILSI